MNKMYILKVLFCCLVYSHLSYSICDDSGLNIIVLGSGGPEMTAGRAASGYLFREGESAVFLIDFGNGAALNFARANASINDLKAVLFTHLHVDHSIEFPALVKAGFFSGRRADLPVLGPSGNEIVPDIRTWLGSLFGGENGAYKYLSEYFEEGGSNFKLRPIIISAAQKSQQQAGIIIDGYEISAIPVTHGPIPALAYRIQRGKCSVTFSGDTSNRTKTLEKLAMNSDLLIAHNAVPEDADHIALSLHMPPSEIARVAVAANIGQLVLSHIMKRTEGRQSETQAIIEKVFKNNIYFANDMDTFPLKGRHSEQGFSP